MNCKSFRTERLAFHADTFFVPKLKDSQQQVCSCSLRLDKLQCHVFWEGETLLHIGWADCVKVARVRPATAGSGAQTDSKRSLQIVASFQMDYLIAVCGPMHCKTLFTRPRSHI